MPRSPRAPLQREAIVDAAREMITTDGLEALSLRRLASKLGVTAPALYAHVDNKQDLIRAVAEGEFDRLVASYETESATDPLARIRAHSRGYVAYSRQHPELFRVMFVFPPDLAPSEMPEEISLPAATQAFAFAASAVEDAIAEGLIETDDALLVTLTLWSAAHGVASILQLGFGLPPDFEEAMIDEVTDRLLAGYRPGA